MVAAASVLAGCSSFPESVDTLPTNEAVTGELDKKWASLPAIKYISAKTGTSVRKNRPLPEEIARAPMKFAFTAPVTVGEFVSALEAQGLRVLLKVSEDKRNERMQMSSYNGTVGGALEMLALAQDLDCEYLNGVILIRQGIRYMVTVPQNKELMGRIPDALAALGAQNVKTDIDSGLVTYEAAAGVNRDVDLYLERMANNASMVSLQIAVIDVRLNRDRASGFDWNEFSAKWGSGITAPKPTTTTPVTPTTGAGAAPVVIPERVLGSLGTLTGDGIALKIDEAKFSMVAAIKLLSKYGKAQTNQDVLISTLSGAPVKISSGSQIPYVSGVGAVAAVGGAVAGSVNTSTVKSGLNIDIVPRYDASEHLVVTNVKAKLSSLVRFRELSAGNAVGTISQPEIQELEFENISRMRPGEIIMLGGIAYDQVSENYTSLAGMEKQKVGSESLTTNRHAIFIVIRPSITIFSPDGVPPADAAAVSMSAPLSKAAI